MNIITFPIALIIFFTLQLRQNTEKVYFVSSKGVYVKVKMDGKKIMVPFKENHSFYFWIKNDTVAMIQDFKNKKLKSIEIHRISTKYDTVYIKRYSVIGDKDTLIMEKTIYRKVY